MEAARLRHPPVVSSLEGTGGHGSLYEHNGDFDLLFSIAQIERTAVCDDYEPHISSVIAHRSPATSVRLPCEAVTAR